MNNAGKATKGTKTTDMADLPFYKKFFEQICWTFELA